MNELEEKISALLSDPAQLESIGRLAERFMGRSQEDEPPAESMPALPAGFDMELLGRMGKLFSAGSGGSDKTALLKAMEPYLAPQRRAKMEKAIQFARMAKIAGAAWKEYGGSGNV